MIPCRRRQYNPLKVHFIKEKVADGGSSTVYRCGPLIDLCLGPHVPNTNRIKAFQVYKVSVALRCGSVQPPLSTPTVWAAATARARTSTALDLVLARKRRKRAAHARVRHLLPREQAPEGLGAVSRGSRQARPPSHRPGTCVRTAPAHPQRQLTYRGTVERARGGAGTRRRCSNKSCSSSTTSALAPASSCPTAHGFTTRSLPSFGSVSDVAHLRRRGCDGSFGLTRCGAPPPSSKPPTTPSLCRSNTGAAASPRSSRPTFTTSSCGSGPATGKTTRSGALSAS